MTSNAVITALIVDDSPDSLGMLNTALNTEGITVLIALGGKQALSIIEQITPDIVLLDAVMPEMDGFDTCRQIKSLRPHLPVIFMTGLTETADIVRGLEAGAVDYVIKPINTDEAIARLKVHVHNSRNLYNARAALDSTGQSILAIDDHGNIQWSTQAALEKLENYHDDPKKLSLDLSKALQVAWRENQENTVSLNGFNADNQLTLSANYLNKLGSHHLVRLTGNSETGNIKLLKDKLLVTQREAEVLLWLSKGKSNWEIGMILGIKPRTINKHLEQVFKKLKVDNRTAAAGITLEAIAMSE